MNKLSGHNLKWGRCHVPGHANCGVIDEIRHPVARTTDKSKHIKEELKALEEPDEQPL